MAKSERIMELVRASAAGDRAGVSRAVELIAADERARQHHTYADKLEAVLRGTRPTLQSLQSAPDVERALVHEQVPDTQLDSLVLPDHVKEAIVELVEEHERAELLRSYGLEPRHRLLLVGPPGNGKTSLAEALAHSLYLPFFTVRYETLIGSFLGETASRLDRLFEFVRTRPCVLFFDEFETVAKERGDDSEMGEVKRVVSSLLMQIDRLPPHVIVVTATNHAELLDRAVWRRFETLLHLPSPDESALRQLICRFDAGFGEGLRLEPDRLAKELRGASFAEARDFLLDCARWYVLRQADEYSQSIWKSRLQKWRTQRDLVNNAPHGSTSPHRDASSSEAATRSRSRRAREA